MELANKLKGERYNAMYKSESYFIFSHVCVYIFTFDTCIWAS